MQNTSTWNKTQISVIQNIVNLLTTFVVCDCVHYDCVPITHNGSKGNKANCCITFEGINKPKILISCTAGGIVEVRELTHDNKGRQVYTLIHSYIL